MSRHPTGARVMTDAMKLLLEEARDLLLERRQGSPARSAAHNARLVIEEALSLAASPPAREEAPAEGDGIDPVVRAAMYRSHVPLNEDRLIKSTYALVTACHRADEREELDEEIDGSMLDDVEEAIAELLAARNRTSEPEAGAVAWRWRQRMRDTQGGVELVFSASRPSSWVNAEDVSELTPLYTHPAPATADKLRAFDVEAYVEDYEFRSDEGDHTPTEDEKGLLIDAIHGVLAALNEGGE